MLIFLKATDKVLKQVPIPVHAISVNLLFSNNMKWDFQKTPDSLKTFKFIEYF